jgi:hypothetical protein
MNVVARTPKHKLTKPRIAADWAASIALVAKALANRMELWLVVLPTAISPLRLN